VTRGDRHRDVTVRTEYSGTDGRITYDSEAETPLATRSDHPFDAGVTARFDRPRPSMEAYDRHVAHLVACLGGESEPVEPLADAVEGDRDPVATGLDGLRQVEVIEAVYESAETGEPVSVDTRALE
jgi:predicted dehydrogenase